MVRLFFSALTNDKGDKSKILKSKMMEVKKNIFMYGSDSVVKAFNKWLCASADGTAEDVQFKYFLNLIVYLSNKIAVVTDTSTIKKTIVKNSSII